MSSQRLNEANWDGEPGSIRPLTPMNSKFKYIQISLRGKIKS